MRQWGDDARSGAACIGWIGARHRPVVANARTGRTPREDEGVDNVAFVHGDAQVYPFASDEFSVAISRSGAMFFADPVAAFTNIGRALRADGRLMLMVWQSIDRNHWIRDLSAILTAGRVVPAPPPGAPGPLSLADPDRVDALLSASGFHDIALADVAAPMCFGATADDAFRFVSGMGFVQFMLKDLDDSARARALDELQSNIDAHASAEGVCYDSAAWLVTRVGLIARQRRHTRNAPAVSKPTSRAAASAAPDS